MFVSLVLFGSSPILSIESHHFYCITDIIYVEWNFIRNCSEIVYLPMPISVAADCFSKRVGPKCWWSRRRKYCKLLVVIWLHSITNMYIDHSHCVWNNFIFDVVIIVNGNARYALYTAFARRFTTRIKTKTTKTNVLDFHEITINGICWSYFQY